MPIVPKLTPQVRIQPLPNVQRAPVDLAESLGAETSRQTARTAAVASGVLANVAETATNLYARQQAENRRQQEELIDRANNVAVTKATTATGQVTLDLQKVAQTKRGHDAMDVPETAMAEYRTQTDKILASLTNARQKEAFSLIQAQRGLAFQGWLTEYTAGELKRFEENEYKASIGTALEQMRAAPTDPYEIRKQLDTAITSTISLAQSQGYGPDTAYTKAQVDATTTAGHYGVITRLLEGNKAQQALDYFNKAKGQIHGDARDKLGKWVEDGVLDKTAQREADRIIAEGQAQNLGLQAMIDAAKAVDDPTGKLRPAIIAEIEHDYTRRKNILRDDELKATSTLVDLIDAAKTPQRVLSESELKRRPEFLLLTTPAERDSVLRYRQQRADNEPDQTNEFRYGQLRDLESDDPAAFVKVNLYAERGNFKLADYRHLQELQAAAKDAVKAASMGPKDGTMVIQDEKGPLRITDGGDTRVTSLFKEKYMTYTGHDADVTEREERKDSEAMVRLGSMKGLVRSEVERESIRLRRPLSPPEIAQSIDRTFLQSIKTVRHGFWGTPQEQGQPLFAVKAMDLPQTVRDQIIKDIRSVQLDPTEARILEWWFRTIEKRPR